MITLSTTGLVFAVLFLALGLAELYVFMRVFQPALSDRFETRKVTYSQGHSPAFVANVVRVQSLVVLPVIGYFIGSFVLGGS
jgi:hypothetical protein